MKLSDLSPRTDDLLVCYQVMFTDYPDIVSVFQLQKMLNISRQLAYDLITSGSINAVKVGNSYRIPKALLAPETSTACLAASKILELFGKMTTSSASVLLIANTNSSLEVFMVCPP